MRCKSGLKFDKCQYPEHDFRIFVNEEWEYTMKRSFAGDETNDSFTLRPPARAFSTMDSTMKWIKRSDFSYSLKKQVLVALPPFVSLGI